MTYTVTIHFSSADKTYTVLRNGWALPQTVGAKGKHATQSLNLSILSAEAFALFATETKQNVKAEVKCDDTVIYQGVVRPYLSTSATGVKEGTVNLEILDYTELLHYYITADEVIEGKTLDGVIDTLFSKAGVDVTRTYPTEFSSDNVLYLPLTEGEYVDDVLSTLLYERGYDYRFTATGCEFFATTTETEPTEAITDIRGTLSVQRDDDWNEGLSVTYPRAKEDDITIYTHKKEGSKANIGGVSVSYPGGTVYTGAKGLYYDSAQHPNETTPQDGKAKVEWNPQYNEKSTDTIRLIGLQNVKVSAWMTDEVGVELGTHLEDITLTGARLWLDYFGDFDYHEIPIVAWFGACQWAWTWNIEVKAHVLYLLDDSVEIASADGARPENNKGTLLYIYTEEMAQKYVQREIKRQKTSSFSYSFNSLTAYTAGSFYKLQDGVTGVSQTVRILSCSQGADGIYTIKAESASTMAISEIDIKKLYYSDMESSSSTAFRISASQTSLQLDSDVSTLTAQGVITASSEITFTWTLGDTTLGTGLSISVPCTALSAGENTITCTATYNSETMATATCVLVKSGKGEKGDSITISSVFYTYGNSDSGTVKPETFSTDTAPEKGKYYWTKTSITYSDSTVTDTYTVAYVGTDGQGEICTITCDRNFVTRNDRATDTLEYVFTVDVQGYTSTPTIQFNFLSDPVTPTQITGTTKWTYAVSLAQKNASSVTATVLLDSVEKDSITLGVVNETGNAKYFGTFTALPTSNTGYISGDSLVYNKLVYLFNGSAWQKTTESSLSTSEKATALSLAMKDVLSGIDKNTLTASEYAYFENVVANVVTADYIGAKNITVDEKGSLQSSNYTNTNNGITGFKLNGSDGSIYANNTVLTNATISGDFYAKSLETQNENQNGSYYATTGFPSEAGTASTTVQGPNKEGTITTLGTLTNTQDNYYQTKDFAQWCLDNIPINNQAFTKLDGTVAGYNAWAMRFSGVPAESFTEILSVNISDTPVTKEISIGDNYAHTYRMKVNRSAVHLAQTLNIKIYDGQTQIGYFYVVMKEEKMTFNGEKITWTQYADQLFTYTVPFNFSAGIHTLKFEFTATEDFEITFFLSPDIVTPYSLLLKNDLSSSNILLMLYSGTDDSAVFNGGTADNPLKVISINSDISDNTTMTKLMQANTSDTGYNTLATNLSYNGSSLICGGTETGWTVTRYAKFLGLYNCGTGSWATPTLAESLSAKVKNVYINGTAQTQEFTVQWNGTTLTLVSDDKTVSYLLSTGDYYTSLPYFCMTGIARSKGAYVSSLFPLEAGVSDIGSASQPFDQIYANSYMNMYPVGAIYISTKPTSPASLFGGQWTALDENHTLWTTAWTDSTTTDLTSESPISAGLPNITGSIQGVADGGTSTHEITGAFNSESNVSSKVAFRNGSYTYAFYIAAIRTFDASAGEVHNGSYSNLVYGKSDTVQPPAYKIYAWKRIS